MRNIIKYSVMALQQQLKCDLKKYWSVVVHFSELNFEFSRG